MIGISNDRLIHSLNVGRLMEEISREKYNWDDQKCKEMFILGCVHDIGYEFSELQEEHPNIGGLLLKNSNYKYWKEVYYHGKVTNEYESEELNLLNIADMQINSFGEKVTIDERIQDIAKRYGDYSRQYFDVVSLREKLKV